MLSVALRSSGVHLRRALHQQQHQHRALRLAGTMTAKATVAVGDRLPSGFAFKTFDAENNMKEVTVDQLTKGKRVVLFAVPGAWTPTCSLKHMPGFIEKADDLKAAGVDQIACVSVNDAFVNQAWIKSFGTDKILMLADGSGDFTRAIGCELDLSDKGLGMRSRRYAMMLEDGVIKLFYLEEGGAFTISSAEAILEALTTAK